MEIYEFGCTFYDISHHLLQIEMKAANEEIYHLPRNEKALLIIYKTG